MAEYTNAALQTVPANGSVLFTAAPIECTRGFVSHREGSGIFTLRGCSNQCYTRYRISFGANIAVPDGGTAAPIAVAVAVAGEPLAASTAIVTPATTKTFFNVHADAYIDAPRGCCVDVSARNIGTQPISVQNANIIITREV